MPSSQTIEQNKAPRKRKRDSDDTTLAAERLLDVAAQTITDTLPDTRKHLRIVTELPAAYEERSPSVRPRSEDSSSDLDSLFDEPHALRASGNLHTRLGAPTERAAAWRTAPPIPGLFFAPTILLNPALAADVLRQCLDAYFRSGDVNQVMLFGRAPGTGPSAPGDDSQPSSGLPPFLNSLLAALATLLRPVVPPRTHLLLFPVMPVRARQAIINLYRPGEGISPHVDLLQRFGDGIVGLSLGSGCVMQFQPAPGGGASSRGDGASCTGDLRRSWDLYLPERSVLVLSGDSRYGWTHGIEGCTEDFVQGTEVGTTNGGKWIARGVRLSITFRWLLPGAEIVGGPN